MESPMLYDPVYILEILRCFLANPSTREVDAADPDPASNWSLAGEELLAACRSDEGIPPFLVAHGVPAMLGMLAFGVQYQDAEAGNRTRSLAWGLLASVADTHPEAVTGQAQLASGIHSVLSQGTPPEDTALAATHILRLALEDQQVPGWVRPDLCKTARVVVLAMSVLQRKITYYNRKDHAAESLPLRQPVQPFSGSPRQVCAAFRDAFASHEVLLALWNLLGGSSNLELATEMYDGLMGEFIVQVSVADRSNIHMQRDAVVTKLDPQ
ncbi:hypothetical protein ACKKBF_B36745 [Auxenochlorella protothecoides x Auxenochlorella symbiontica]|uniref:Uncharacterized protein n=1 Tax=Auxenochlorella protothecoides TaxID=3075 RepID=A0A1D1ZRD9_AUXPR